MENYPRGGSVAALLNFTYGLQTSLSVTAEHQPGSAPYYSELSGFHRRLRPEDVCVCV